MLGEGSEDLLRTPSIASSAPRKQHCSPPALPLGTGFRGFPQSPFFR